MDWITINQTYVRPALSARDSGDIQKAESIFRQGLAATGNDGFVALNFAELLEACVRPEEAKDMFELALRKLPKLKFKQQAKEGLDRVRRQAGEPTPETGSPAGTELRNVATRPAAGEPPRPITQPSTGQTRTATQAKLIGLISCTNHKKKCPCTARELYSESVSFPKHLAFAEDKYDRVYVVSSKHGLVELNQLLSPYDLSLTEYTAEERAAWAKFIAARLRLEGVTTDDTVYIHASDVYAAPLRDALDTYGIQCRIIDFDRSPNANDVD